MPPKSQCIGALAAALGLAWLSHAPSPVGMQHLGSGAMFDGIAPFYDSANRVMSLNLDQSWRRVLVDELGLERRRESSGSEALDVLDIASGTGDVAIMIARDIRRLGLEPLSSVVAMDPSPRMLSFANTKIDAANLSSLVSTQVGNAEQVSDLSKSGKKFDAVTISFGIRNFADRSKALVAIRQVLKYDSRVAILEFATPRGGFLAPVVRLFLKMAVPLLGTLVAGRAHAAEYAHLRDSILNFPHPDDFVTIMSKAGLSNCQSRNVFLDVVYLFSCKGYEVSESEQTLNSGY
jgi:demethylmenaquinone methyltransferase/2-methoxy-6-polyprenyl-1,4-benzoquinol methylase